MIEERQQALIDELSPCERIARSLAMFDWARGWIARQIVAERGPMPQARLQWEVALRLYGDEAGSRQMIERHLAGISRDVCG